MRRHARFGDALQRLHTRSRRRASLVESMSDLIEVPTNGGELPGDLAKRAELGVRDRVHPGQVRAEHVGSMGRGPQAPRSRPLLDQPSVVGGKTNVKPGAPDGAISRWSGRGDDVRRRVQHQIDRAFKERRFAQLLTLREHAEPRLRLRRHPCCDELAKLPVVSTLDLCRRRNFVRAPHKSPLPRSATVP